MKSFRIVAAVLFLVAMFTPTLRAEPIFALTSTRLLLRFDSAAPGTILASIPITGLPDGETLETIDFRTATAQLYAVGATSQVYVINIGTGVATAVGSQFVPALSGTAFGMGFNPTVDRIRMVSDMDQSLRLNPNTGAVAATDTQLLFAPGDPNVNSNPTVVGVGYTNKVPGAATATLYGVDGALDIAVRIGSVDGSPESPNTGLVHTLGPLGVNIQGNIGFDISGATGLAYMSTRDASSAYNLYTINLATGAATLVGSIPNGGAAIDDIAVFPPCGPNSAHTIHGHISSAPPSHSGNVSHEHHGQHGHEAPFDGCIPHAPGHTAGLMPEPEGLAIF